MKQLTINVLLSFFCLMAFAQKKQSIQQIKDEGYRLYKSEMASWHGTDIFLERLPNKKNDIGGYLSYSVGSSTKCIFYSKDSIPKVIGAVTFDSAFNVQEAKLDTQIRNFTATENDLYVIRTTAKSVLLKDTSTLFYKDMSYNFDPLIDDLGKRVYVFTGPQKTGIVVFGNDYYFRFNKSNKLILEKHLHHNIITISETNNSDSAKTISTMHTHLPETGDLITPTDICTLMLYEPYDHWNQHYVIGKKTVTIWTKSGDIIVLSRKAFFNK